MIFGTVSHGKTLCITDSCSGVTAQGIGFPDFALPYRRNALFQIANYITYGFVDKTQNEHYQQMLDVDHTYNQQVATIRSSVYIFNGSRFPRGNLTLSIGNMILTGHFGNNNSNQSIFYIDGGSSSQHPSHKDSWRAGVVSPAGSLFGIPSGPGVKVLPYAAGYYVGGGGSILYPHRYFVPTGEVIGDNAGYHYIEPGATVKIASNEAQQFIVSITPGTVLRVVAWATKYGQRFIQDVPTNWYSVSVRDFGPIQATVITLNDALSKNQICGFEDKIYVTFKSTVGPNTVDILKYLIDTYSDLTYDSTSFNHVRTKIANYPSHFALYKQKDIISVLQEIAWQARCAIYLKNGVFYLIYLPERQTAVDTILKSDILVNTLSIGHTPTEELVTKMNCRWRVSGIQEEDYTTVLRHNIKKYGTQEQNYDYYIYDFADAVVKSATFWLIRYSNTWKKARFSTPLTKLNLETFDFVNLNLGDIVADSSVLVMIESANYQSNDNTINIECWCPVKAGTMEEYIFAYPSIISQAYTFPTPSEIQDGFMGSVGPGNEIIARIRPPISGISCAGTNWPEENEYEEEDPYNQKETEDDDRRKNDRGDPNPTDVGAKNPGEKKKSSKTENMRASAAGPNTPDYDSPIIPQPSGWGGQSKYPEGPPPGPDSGNGEVTKSEKQDALDELPDADRAEFADCPYVDVYHANITKVLAGGEWGCDKGPGSMWHGGTYHAEKVVFNTNAEAAAYALSLRELDQSPFSCGTTIIFTAYERIGNEDCQGTGKTDGPIAYKNTDPSGWGSGAALDGVSSIDYG